MGCAVSSSAAAATLEARRRSSIDEPLQESPTIWVGNIPAAFGNINELGLVEAVPLTQHEISEAFKEYGEVISVTLRKKGGEFDEKSWALVTFDNVVSARRALKGDTVVIDSAFDEVLLQVKRADIGAKLQAGGKGALASVAKQQATVVKKKAAQQSKKEKGAALQEQRSRARIGRKKNKAKAGVKLSEAGSSSVDEIDDRPPNLFGGESFIGKREMLQGGESFVVRKRDRRVSATVSTRERRAKNSRRKSMTTPAEVVKDVDREAAWSTAWIGGIPVEFLHGGKAEFKVLRLMKSFGDILRVTVRKKKEEKAGDYKSWAFVTFKEARSVSMAMRDGVRINDYAVQLRIEPADIEGELQKNGQGALGEKWAEQQAKVLRAKAQDSVAPSPPSRRRTSSQKDAPYGEADVITSDKTVPKTPSVRRGRRGSVIGVKYELKD